MWDFKTNGSHALIGECRSTLAHLLALAETGTLEDRTLDLVAPPSSSSKGHGAASGPKQGTLVVRSVMVRQGPSPGQLMQGCLTSCLA